MHISSTVSMVARISWTILAWMARPILSQLANSVATWSLAARVPTCISNSPWICLKEATWWSKAPATKLCPCRWLSSTSYSATWSSWPIQLLNVHCPSSMWRLPHCTPWLMNSCSRPSTPASSKGSCNGRTSNNAWSCSHASSSNGGTRRACFATPPSENGWCGELMARAQTSSVTPGQSIRFVSKCSNSAALPLGMWANIGAMTSI